MRETLKRLSATGKYEIFELGAGYKQWNDKREMMIPKQPYPKWLDWSIYPIGGRLYGQDCTAQFANLAQIDIVVPLLDPWMGSWLTCPETYRDASGEPLTEETIKLIRNRKWKIAWWYPIDGLSVDGKFPIHQAKWMIGAEHLICFSEWGKKHTQINTGRDDVLCFPFGVDTNVFVPRDKEFCRRTINFDKKLSNCKKYFVVFCGNANRTRKDFPAALEGFAKFAKDKNDAYLYLHTNVNGEGYDLVDLSQRMGLSGKVIIPEGITMQQGVSEDDLCTIINASDVAMSVTRGEGRGMFPLEARACGKLCFTTNVASCTELVCDEKELIKPAFWSIDGRNNIIRPFNDSNDIAEKLQWAYENKDNLINYRDVARDKAMESDWDLTSKGFEELFDNV
jgi:glycosyltransferase involved in cell wall biosynthesis